jgi:hypothetical protein
MTRRSTGLDYCSNKVRDGVYASLEKEKEKQVDGPLVQFMIAWTSVGGVARLGDMTGSTPAAPGRIFLSYRREEADFPAGWLDDRLAAHFGRDQVFRDVDDIRLGANFPEVIAKAVASCDVLLALIGSQWVTITDEEGKRRLDDPNDFVRLEIEAALQRGVLVIPILVRGAKMPPAQQLPASLAELVHRNALELSPTRFDFDTGRLLEVLDATLAEERARRDAAKQARRRAEQKSGLQLSQTEVDFGTLIRGAVSPWRTIQLQHAGTGPLNARVSTEEPWIALQLLGATIQLRIDTAVPGRLDGELHITSDAGDASVPVRALVRPGPIVAVEPSLVDFRQVDTRARPEVLVRVTKAGRGELQWTHEPSGTFFRTERVPEGLHLRLDAAPPGRHHGSVAVRSNGARHHRSPSRARAGGACPGRGGGRPGRPSWSPQPRSCCSEASRGGR